MNRWGNEGRGGGSSQQPWNPYPAGPPANNLYNSQQNAPPSTQPAEEVDMSEFRKVLLKGEPKVLGAVQLLIAFISIMLGSIMLRLDNYSERYTYTSAYGFNFWSVPFFIISGSLSVSVEVKQNPSRMFVKSFMSMNTVSAIEALGSIIIYCYDIHRSEYFGATFLTVVLVFAVIANLLEFCIAVSLSHFGRLAKDAMTVRQSSAQVYSIPTQYSNPMASAPDPTQRFGGPSPQFQPQNYNQPREADGPSPQFQPPNYNQPREADYRFPTAQSGLQRTPTFSQQNYQGANDNRMLNRYNMYN
ncbi:membrane-spanning 4-domains subfamily A member 15-like [Aquarana catesbeiana]|uniref:membrane-spanning 4-domains subfamily A member 15-like n=1 Tax=Aquarana catesbeiana TaxID=8400 RepID=UPI003CC9E371